MLSPQVKQGRSEETPVGLRDEDMCVRRYLAYPNNILWMIRTQSPDLRKRPPQQPQRTRLLDGIRPCLGLIRTVRDDNLLTARPGDVDQPAAHAAVEPGVAEAIEGGVAGVEGVSDGFYPAMKESANAHSGRK